MKDYMDPRNWDEEEINECKYWALGMGACLTVVYIAMWIFY